MTAIALMLATGFSTVEAKIVFTKQPVDTITVVNSTVYFSVAVSGVSSPKYQWEYTPKQDKSIWIKYEKGTGAILFLKAISELHGCMFRCVVTDGGNQAISNIAFLYVADHPGIFFTKQPANTFVSAGTTAIFSVAVSENVSSPKYQWEFSPKNSSNWTKMPIVKSTDAVLTIPNVGSGTDGHKFRCVVTVGDSKAISDVATLTVYTPPTLDKEYPKNASVDPGADANFAVYANGNPAPTYRWEVSTDYGKTWGNVTDNSTATSNKLSLRAVTPIMNNYRYRCLAFNAYGFVTSKEAILEVNTGPIITKQPPKNVVLVIGHPCSISIEATDNPKILSYQWEYKAFGKDYWLNVRESPRLGSGTKTAKLTLNYKDTSLNGSQYRCIVTNRRGSTRSDATTLEVRNP